MKILIFCYFLIIPVILHGQNNPVQLIEPSLIKSDLDSLISNLIQVHPTFQSYYQENDIQKKIDSIKNEINKPMSPLDFFRIMQPLVCIDGHTTLTYNGDVYPKIDNPFFPFRVVIHENNLYVKENLSLNELISKGMIIEKINGIHSGTIVKDLIRYLPGEKESYKLKSLEKDFHIIYRLVYGSCSEFNISINHKEWKLNGAKWEDFKELQKPKFELRFYDNDIAYICKRSFKPPKDFIAFIDSAFRIIADKKIKYLIIDNLRGGGLTDLADSLMSYFTDKPYSMFEKKMTKISYLTKKFIEDNKQEGIIKNGYLIQEFNAHKTDRKNIFSGPTYILTGPLSYSAGTCFPASAKCYNTANIVGEESGQPLLSNGDLDKIVLKNTQLTCVTSLARIYMPCNNNDTMTGVLPDYKVNPTLDDLLNDRDYTLEYTLKLIREEKKLKTK